MLNLFRLSVLFATLFLVTLWLTSCTSGSGQRFAYGYALGSMAAAPRPTPPPAFTHYMTPGGGMTTCHHLGGGMASCF